MSNKVQIDTIASKALLVSINIGLPGNIHQNKEITKSAINALNKEATNEDEKIREESGNWQSKRFPKDALKPFGNLQTEARNYHYFNTLPWIDGYRMLNSKLYFDYFEGIRKLRTKFDELIESHFCPNYDKFIDWAKEKHGKQFVAMLAKFRPRKANEIPTELGVCIPHGFIADDGKTATDIKQSLRWPDAPGVLYTIHTGTVDERKMKTSLITAAGSAAVGLLGSYAESEVKPFVTERIGPRPYQIGGLKASQGGVALKISRPGKKPFEAYNVFTGYSGWLGTEALPYILVEMSTRTMEQAQELKQNPPPFQQSMGRLEILLKSTRLRPTTPLMPDLANLPKQ